MARPKVYRNAPPKPKARKRKGKDAEPKEAVEADVEES